jgi:hypothetical protein
VRLYLKNKKELGMWLKWYSTWLTSARLCVQTPVRERGEEKKRKEAKKEERKEERSIICIFRVPEEEERDRGCISLSCCNKIP